MSEGPPVDLSECDREPIHVPGAIQPHGLLFVLREPSLEILQISENVRTRLDLSAPEPLGRRLHTLLDAGSAAALRHALGSGDLDAHDPLPITLGGSSWIAVIHRHLGATVLELEPAPAVPASIPGPSAPLRPLLARIQSADALQSLLDAAVAAVKRLTGFERVLAYRFDPDDHGEVVAEVRADDQPPYLGLHYPASDIPAQARALYRLNPMRLIPDATYVPVPIIPPTRPDTGEPLDLSFSVLRSVSPVHREYMRNMDVRSSMSLSLLHRDRLWGLIGCLDRAPRFVPYETRALCEVLSRTVSLQITALEEMAHGREVAARRVHLREAVNTLSDGAAEGVAPLDRCPEALLALADADGVAVCAGERVRAFGRTPPPDGIAWLRRTLAESYASGLFHSSALGRAFPALEPLADTASGVLAIRLPRTDAHEVIWFRPEVTRTVDWAGDPEKSAEPGEEGRLRPRRSFALWREEVRLIARPWTQAVLEVAADLRRHVLEHDLAHQVERALRAIRAREDMVAVVSHDLRGPLSAMKIQATLMSEEDGPQDPAETREAGRRIGRSVARMERLIDDLLDAARIEAGRFDVRLQPLSLRDVVAQVDEAFGDLAASEGIAFETSVPSLRVLADPDRLFQVFSNLVGNALRHTPAGGRVHVAARRAGIEVEVAVTDTGEGIEPHALPSVFDRHVRSTDSGGAAGLGLFICRGIVEAHGGTIRVESERGRGARFVFGLPVAPEA